MIKKSLEELLEERILLLDGGMGTMIQGFGLSEKDHRTEQFANVNVPLKGCNDVLALTAPDILRHIHDAYLSAGADIISTNSFNATSISLADYYLEEYTYDINRAAAAIACECAREFTKGDPAKPRFVAGSVGPTNYRSSAVANINNPKLRKATVDMLTNSYIEQICGLLDGGVDVILIETIFDMLNAEAAISAVNLESKRRGFRVPFMLSVTLAKDGLTLSGDSIEAFYASIVSTSPLSVGVNCSYGARHIAPYLERLAEISKFPISTHPNAGLPNLVGHYHETPQALAADMEELIKSGVVNIVGGCCGTTPEHIAEIAAVAQRYSPLPIKRSSCCDDLEIFATTHKEV